MVVIDADPAPLRTGMYGWNSCGAASPCCGGRQLLKSTPQVSFHSLGKSALSCISVQGHKALVVMVCTTKMEQISSVESGSFTQHICSHLRERKSLWGLCSRGKEEEVPAYFWEKVVQERDADSWKARRRQQWGSWLAPPDTKSARRDEMWGKHRPPHTWAPSRARVTELLGTASRLHPFLYLQHYYF